jgi:hypothetical protein
MRKRIIPFYIPFILVFICAFTLGHVREVRCCNDPEKKPLDIEPLYERDAEPPEMSEGFLEARKKHRFRVLYNGMPLGNAAVTVITGDGWERTETTGPKGIFGVLPAESGEGEGSMLCAVSHRDASSGEIHSATLTMRVLPPVSEWKDQFLVFAFYALGAVCLSVFFVLYRINVRKKRDARIMTAFERHKIQEA